MKQAKSSRMDNSGNDGGGGSGKSAVAGMAGRLGYSVGELVDRLSRLYSCRPNRALERKVAVALRRGVDYGILVRSRNRYRYDPDTSLRNSLRGTGVRKRRKQPITRRRRTSSTPKKVVQPPPSSTSSKPRVPRPTVPPPPNFQPPPKILTREPFGKVIKHSSPCLH